MSVKFTVQASDLKKALDLVGIAPPQDITNKSVAGYLFVVRGNGECFVYSQNKYHVARAPLRIDAVEGEGAFIYPVQFTPIFSQMDSSEEITFEAGEREGSFYVNYVTGSGSSSERPTVDPKSMRPIDDSAEAGTKVEVPALLLRKGVSAVDDFRAPMEAKLDSKEEVFKSIQVFDASKPDWEKGDGYMFATDGHCGGYFYCDAFKGKGMAIYGAHLGPVSSFLSKSSGNVTLRVTDNWNFLTNSDGQLLGWTHHAQMYPVFRMYPEETFKFQVSTSFLARTLDYMRTALGDPKKNRVRMVYDANGGKPQIQFYFKEPNIGTVRSSYIAVSPLPGEAETGSFEVTASIDHWKQLVKDMDFVNQITIKVAISKAKKEGAKDRYYFRVSEKFYVDPSGKTLLGPTDGCIECRMVRFVPSLN